MLSGNLSFDTKKEGEDEEEGGTSFPMLTPAAGPASPKSQVVIYLEGCRSPMTSETNPAKYSKFIS